jgi:hypothetical protein
VIVRAALCPHPPLLFRELVGHRDPAAELRSACRAAVASLAGCDAVVVVGGADESAEWDPALGPDVRRFGTTGARTCSGLPLSLGVGRRLLQETGWTGPVELQAIAWDADLAEIRGLAGRLAAGERSTGLLALGEGSARRGDKAPGYLDERAFGFDDALADALGSGDARALLDVDPGLADELMVLGRAAIQVLAAVAVVQGSAPKAMLDYRDDPFGVSYLVARWRLARPAEER